MVFTLGITKESRPCTEGTLYGELGLRFNGGISIVRHAGVDAGILLCEIGDLKTASSQHLHTALTGDTKEQCCGKGKRENLLDLTVSKSFHPILFLIINT